MNPSIIASQIEQKKKFFPYSPNPLAIFEILTDVNEFPYRRFFRGKIDSDMPHIWDREAGFSPLSTSLQHNSYPDSSSLFIASPNTPFQVPCSTQFPIPPLSKNNDKSPFESSQFGCVFLSP